MICDDKKVFEAILSNLDEKEENPLRKGKVLMLTFLSFDILYY